MTIVAVLPHYSMVPGDDFVAEFPRTGMVGVNLNQTNATELRNCIIPWKPAGATSTTELAWAGKLGKSIYDKGRQVLWSIPYPGAGQLEAVNEGEHDDLYIEIANELLKVAPKDNSPIYVRPPWEFNLDDNTENRMLDRAGKPSTRLGRLSWRRIAALFRSVSTRFRIVWSPSIERKHVVDPQLVWPGLPFVDVIAPDFYMGDTFGHKPGQFETWFKEDMLRIMAFAKLKGKPFGFAEIGFENDSYLADAKACFALANTASPGLEFVQWWNDWQKIDCRMTASRSPQIAAAFRAAFAA